MINLSSLFRKCQQNQVFFKSDSRHPYCKNKCEDVTMCAYVESTVTEAAYFASPCKFGPGGVKEVMGFGELSAYEKGWFDKMMPELKGQIQKGIDFANK